MKLSTKSKIVACTMALVMPFTMSGFSAYAEGGTTAAKDGAAAQTQQSASTGATTSSATDTVSITSTATTNDTATTEVASSATTNTNSSAATAGAATSSADSAAAASSAAADASANVTLTLDNASVVYQGKTITTSQVITATAGQALTFSATADNGYKISGVKLVANGIETELTASGDSYVVDAAFVADGIKIAVQTVETPAATEDAQAAGAAFALTAQAETSHAVTFTSCNKTVMEQTIADGKYATAPDDPAATGDTPANSEFIGWSLDGTTVIDVSTYAVTADTNFIAVFKTPVSHTVTINYMYEDTNSSEPGTASTSMAYQPYQAVVSDGASYAATVQSPTITGFHLYKPSQATVTLDYTNITKDESVTVVYSGDPSYYTVKYTFEQLDGSYEEDTALAPEVQKTGSAGAQTDATANSITGYTVAPIVQATIATANKTDPDQTVVTVKYNRTVYAIDYDTDGGSYIAPAAYKYGATVTAPAENPTKLGYTFQGWDTDGDGAVNELPSTMPANNVTAKAIWKQNEKATYTVVYWQQKISDKKATVLDTSGKQSGVKNGQSYDYVKSTTHAAATVGSTVEPEAADQTAATGFVYNPAQSVGVEVEADGSTILNVYYDRQYITFNFYTNSSRATRCNPAGDAISSTMTYTYGNLPEGAVMTGLFGQTLESNGYSWPTIATSDTSTGTAVAGTSLFIDYQEGSYTTFLTSFISRNNSYTTHDFYVPGALTYPNTIMHWKQNTDGSYSDAATNQTGAQSNTTWNFSNKYNGFTVSYYKMSLSSDTVTLPVNADYTGWLTCNPSSAASIEATDASGATVRSGVTLRILYTRNMYNVSFLNPDGSSAGLPDASVYYEGALSKANPGIATGTTSDKNGLTRPATADADYTFEGWYTDPACTSAVTWDTGTMAANNLAVYAKWAKPKYTVTFDSNGGSAEAAQTVDKYSTITVPTPTREGYTFTGWYYDTSYKNAFVGTTQITSNITLHAKWQKTGTANYTAYYTDKDGNYFKDTKGTTTTDKSEAYTTTGSAKIGTAATVSPIAIEGYYPASGSKSIAMTANDDDNTVVFIYKPAVTWNYTINCYNKTTGELLKTNTAATYSEQEAVWPEGISGYKLASTYQVYNLTSKNNTLDLYYTQDPTFQVTYNWGSDVPDGVTLPTDSKTYHKGEMVHVDTTYTSATVIEDAVKDGVKGTWTFSGWGDDFAISKDPTIIQGSWTFTPTPAPAGQYTVTYQVSGDLPAGYIAPVDEGSYNVGDAVAVAATPDMSVYPGYTFTGWTLDGTTVTSASMVEGGLVLKGVWKKNTGSGTTDTTGTTDGTAVTGETISDDSTPLGLPKTGDQNPLAPLGLIAIAAMGVGLVAYRKRSERD